MDIVTLKLNMPDGAERHFFHRGTHWDDAIIQNVLVGQEYSLTRLKRGNEIFSKYLKIVESGKTPLIIDAGANIGTSVFFFSQCFPQAHIVAVEPDPSNFTFLKMNSAGLRVDVIHGGVASEDGYLDVVDLGLGELGYRTEISPNGKLPALGLGNLVHQKMLEGFVPFLVKIDVEGAEGEIFSRNTSWIDDTYLIVIELHDWLLTGTSNSNNFLKAISQFNRDFVYVGENIFSIKN